MIRHTPTGRQFYPLGRRHHHGLAGLELITIGILLCWHDRHDWRHWLTDFARHPAWNQPIRF